MTFFDKTIVPSFDYPTNIDIVVCCDLDETYLPFDDLDKQYSGIDVLEKFINMNGDDLALIIGWVTGSNLESSLRKTETYISKLPHFIASSLGTELHWIEGHQVVEDVEWIERINKSGYKKKNLDKIVEKFEREGIHLTIQSSDYQGKYKGAYYYEIRDSISSDFKIMEDIAWEYSTKILFNKCNPAAGDPVNSYDIEFIPACCGKDQVLLFLQNKFILDRSHFWAFGDSCNDLTMFREAENSFLVANAASEAKAKHCFILSEKYCHGIVAKLKELVSES